MANSWVEKFGDEPFLRLLDAFEIKVDDKAFPKTDYTICQIHKTKYIDIRGIKCCKDCLTDSIQRYIIAQQILEKLD